MKRKSPIRMSRKQRLQELATFVALCFACIDETDPKEIANLAGVSESTIRRLLVGNFSLAVHYGTIQGLSLAAGLRLEMAETSARVSLARKVA